MLSFVGKHRRFLPKRFPYLVKYVENKVSISTTHKKKREREKEELKQFLTSKTSILKDTLKTFKEF